MKNMERNNSIIITSIIAGVILLVAIGFLVTFGPSGSATQNTVNVQGTATVKAMPDLIKVYISIENNGTTSAEANDKNSVILNNVINDLVTKEGFTKNEIVTESFNIYQDYTYNNGVRKDNGYKAVHTLSVEINATDPTKASRVVGIVLGDGATVSSINFELSQELQNKYKAEAMKEASQDAQIKAQAIAEGLNKKVGKLVSVTVNDWGYHPWYAYGAVADSATLKQAETSIQPGNQDITASVSVVFKIE